MNTPEPVTATHTPGPWRVEGGSIVTTDVCSAVIEDDGGYEAPIEQRRANAALIARAPALEAQNAALVAALEEVIDGMIPHKRDFLVTAYAINLARAALALAKGAKS